MKKVLLSALLAAMLIFPLGAYADNSIKAVPYLSQFDTVVHENGLRGFLETYAVVEKNEDGWDKFSIKRSNSYRLPDTDWLVELSLAPRSVDVVTYSDFEVVEVTWASMLVTLEYIAPDEKHSSPGIDRVIRLWVTIKTVHASTLSKDQVNTLVQSVKTKTPVRIKGRLIIGAYGETLENLKESFKNLPTLTVEEINGGPVLPAPFLP